VSVLSAGEELKYVCSITSRTKGKARYIRGGGINISSHFSNLVNLYVNCSDLLTSWCSQRGDYWYESELVAADFINFSFSLSPHIHMARS
jgi:hypothetical protein